MGSAPTDSVHIEGFEAVRAGRNSTCSLLFIAGESDDLVPEKTVEQLQRTLETENTAMKECKMIIVEKAGHAFVHQPMSDEDKIDSERLLTTAVQWLLKELLPSVSHT